MRTAKKCDLQGAFSILRLHCINSRHLTIHHSRLAVLDISEAGHHNWEIEDEVEWKGIEKAVYRA